MAGSLTPVAASTAAASAFTTPADQVTVTPAGGIVSTEAQAAFEELDAEITLNTTHAASDGKDHSDVVLANTHRGLTNNPHSVTAAQAGAKVSGAVEAISTGGTGQITQQAAIDALTAVSGATNEHVLTKDTATGNAIFKAASGAGAVDVPIVSETAAHTVVAGDKGKCIRYTSSTTADRTVTLLAPATAGDGFPLWVRNDSLFLITVTDGTFSTTVSPNCAKLVGCDGSSHHILDSHVEDVDITAATADVTLEVGQTGYVDVSAASSPALQVKCGDGQAYEIDMAFEYTAVASGAGSTLKPNNTTYASAFTQRYIQGVATALSGNAVTISAFGMDSVGAPPKVGKLTVHTSTNEKRSIFSGGGTSTTQSYVGQSATEWNDTSTVWSSLGTFVFPTTVTGRIHIRRIT